MAILCVSGRGLATAWTFAAKVVTDNAGNDLSANLSDPTTIQAGLYYVDYTVASDHPTGTVRLLLAGTAATGTRYATVTVHVGKYDPELALMAYDPPTNAEMGARTLPSADYATAASQTAILDTASYTLAALAGACADAGTAAETYAITINGSTYTIDHTGLDSTGNRGTATLNKT